MDPFGLFWILSNRLWLFSKWFRIVFGWFLIVSDEKNHLIEAAARIHFEEMLRSTEAEKEKPGDSTEAVVPPQLKMDISGGTLGSEALQNCFVNLGGILRIVYVIL